MENGAAKWAANLDHMQNKKQLSETECAEVVRQRIARLPTEKRAKWEAPPTSYVNEIARSIVVQQWIDEAQQESDLFASA